MNNFAPMRSPGWAPNGFSDHHFSPGWLRGDGIVDGRSATVHIGEVEFHTLFQDPPQGGHALILQELDGWWEPASDSSAVIPHPTGDGSVVTGRYRAARMVELRGLIYTNGDASALYRGQAELARLSAGAMRVREVGSGVETVADVRKVEAQFTRLTPSIARFTLIVRADDPLRYLHSQRDLTNGANVLVNLGDVDAHPVITLTGPHSALSIAHPGGTFSFPALASGTRVIDCRNGDVWNGNTRVFPAVSGAWPVVKPGGSTWTISGLGAGTARANRVGAYS